MPEGDPAAGMKKGHSASSSKGDKLNGAWHLVRLKRRGRGKARQLAADQVRRCLCAAAASDILEDAPQSVKSGLTIEDIAAGRSRRKAKPPSAKAEAETPAQAGRARPARPRCRDFIAPCLATLRADAAVRRRVAARGQVRRLPHPGACRRRQGQAATPAPGSTGPDRFGKRDRRGARRRSTASRRSSTARSWCWPTRASSSFSALQAGAFGRPHRAHDLLRVRPAPSRRRGSARRAAGRAQGRGCATCWRGARRAGRRCAYSEHFAEPGQGHAGACLPHGARRRRLEARRRALSQRPRPSTGSSRNARCARNSSSPAICRRTAAGRGVRSLVVGYHEDGKLTLRPATSAPASPATSRPTSRRSSTAASGRSRAFDGAAATEKSVVWVKPELVAEIEFRAWTADGILRHASFQGLREDKPAEEVVAEMPEPAEHCRRREARRRAGRRPRPRRGSRGQSVTLSNADKLLWPEAGVTKQDLLDHYEQVWPRMEHFVVNRPLAWCARRTASTASASSRSTRRRACMRRSSASHDPEDGEELLYIAISTGWRRWCSSASSRSISGARRSTRSTRPTRSSSTSIRTKGSASRMSARRRST